MHELTLPTIKVKNPEINMSPLVDVVFLLLIFFMVTTVFPDDKGVIIEKPESEQATSVSDDHLIVKIDAESSLFFQDKKLAIKDLERVLKNQLTVNNSLPVIINADKMATTEILVKVIDAAKSSGAKQLGLATNDKTNL